ncbi:Steroid 5-alpha-reductase DET2 [Raphanus sativus]|uniref:Steroid 5-alpha-reductase DET2 n=1 Tax=Raphanus sativus TaxID=3726 RepID=A0A6J0NFS7_RAPSA|nr:steroid 5-alpha-reductase DET2 [Raphanus sativus]KAJ4903833.1 Steroid 5-alpha-reductase DET2 [Raphanus sativus]
MKEIADQNFFRYCLLALIYSGPPTAIALKFLQAPYGKHNRTGWGPTLSPPLAWFLMESPTLWLSLLLFPFGRHFLNPKSLLLFSPYLLHYFHRTIIYPLRLLRSSSPSKKGFPISVAAMAFTFNLFNAYIQARYVSHYKNDYEVQWFWWRFIVGSVIFVTGMWINITSDRTLVRLKKEHYGVYVIPRGGLFEFVSCPNYFGEVVEWFGWGVMTWSWPGIGFFLYTCSNLIPRAHASHIWYNDKFRAEYPKTRKAVIPFVF